MIRADHILSLVGAAAAGFGLGALALVATTLPRSSHLAFNPDTLAPAAASTTTETRTWPPLFGEEPAQSAAATPQVAVLTVTYSLRGVVANGDGGWAIIAGPEGDQMVSVGATLEDGSVVIAIAGSGVEIERNGERLLIGFQDGLDSAVAEMPPALPTSQTSNLSLAEIRKDDFRRMLGLAGGAQVIQYDQDTLAQEIVWVRNGRLYDRIGLKAGDIVLTINGLAAGDIEAIGKAAGTLVQEREFELEVIRAGARMTIKVMIDEDV